MADSKLQESNSVCLLDFNFSTGRNCSDCVKFITTTASSVVLKNVSRQYTSCTFVNLQLIRVLNIVDKSGLGQLLCIWRLLASFKQGFAIQSIVTSHFTAELSVLEIIVVVPARTNDFCLLSNYMNLTELLDRQIGVTVLLLNKLDSTVITITPVKIHSDFLLP